MYKTIIISFIDDYKNVRKNYNILMYHGFGESDFEIIGKNFSKIAKSHGMSV